MGGQPRLHENPRPVQRLSAVMPVAASTISDFVNDHPGEAYGIVAAVVLLLILFLLVRRRTAKQTAGGVASKGAVAPLSRKDARRAKKEEKAMVKADAKAAKAKAKVESKQAKADAKAEKKAAKAQAKADKK